MASSSSRLARSCLRMRTTLRRILTSKPLPLASAKTSLICSAISDFSCSRRSMRSMMRLELALGGLVQHIGMGGGVVGHGKPLLSGNGGSWRGP